MDRLALVRNAVLGLLLLVCWPASCVEAGQKEKVGANGKVLMGSTVVRQGDRCAVLGAALSAESFLDGLERFDSPRGPEYRKGSVRVTQFPEQVLVQVGAANWPCGSGIPEVVIPDAGDKLDRRLRFEVRWKRGGKSRPAEVLSVEPYHPPMQEFDDRWFYYIKVRGRGVPLSDHLILTILTEDGKRVTRLSARL